jgi:MFS family permease
MACDSTHAGQTSPVNQSATSSVSPAAPPDGTKPDPLSARPGTFGALVEYTAFRKLWLAAVASAMGQWMQSTALAWLALDLTDSESFVGIVAFSAGLPFLLVSVPAGLIIDRFDRRTVLVVCQIIAAVLSITVAIDVLSGQVQPWHLPIAGFVNGSLQATLNPTQQSIVPSLVPRERLTNAIGLMGAGQNGTRVIGPTIAGAVIGFSGTGQAFLLQSIAIVAALIVLLGTRFPERIQARTVASLASLFEGFRVVRNREDLRSLILLASIPTLFVFPYISFLSVFARDVLDIGPQGMGMLLAASGFGAVFGSLFVASRPGTQSGRLLTVQTALYGVVVIVFAFTRFLPLGLSMLFLGGFLGSSVFNANSSLIQHRIEDSIRGRVMGIYMLTWGLMPLGAMPMGLLGSHIGIPEAVSLGAVVSTTLTCALYVRSPVLRAI